jgi:glycine betaine catabolism A
MAGAAQQFALEIVMTMKGTGVSVDPLQVDLAQLELTRRPFAVASTLPGAAYSAPQWFQLDEQALFAKQWLCVGRAAELLRAGDYRALTLAGDSILLLRGQDSKLRAFFNVCRHRGSRLIDERAGNVGTRVTCPYHAWSYDTEGRLHTAPQMPGGFCKDDHGLVAIALACWNGFVFVNLDAAAPALGSAMSGLPDLDRYRIAELDCGRRFEYEVHANWKLVVENYSECYHCPGAHPQLHKLTQPISRSERAMEIGSGFNGGPMRLRDGVQTMSMSGASSLPLIPGLSHDDSRYVYYYVIYPNFLLSPHPDYVMTHVALPVAPDRTRVVCEFLFTQEALQRPGFDPADVVEFWDVTNRQDWALCERAQAGVASRGYRQGPYGVAEDCVHRFDHWYADRVVEAIK